MADEKYTCLDDFAKVAHNFLQESRFNYFADGCNEQFTLKENREAFKRYRLRPKLLCDVSKVDLNTTILGQNISWPVGVSPTAFHRSADYNEGEIATAKAACGTGSVMILSCVSTATIEDVAAANPSVCWMQVQFFKQRHLTKQIIKRSEEAGYKAIVLTVDQPCIGKKYRTTRDKAAFKLTFHSYEKPVNLNLGTNKNGDEIITEFDDSATWQDVRWIKSITKLPLVLKGITTADQAKLAVLHGANAILVSNHGGRQLDYLPATIDILPEVVAAVQGSNVEVFMDGGVRHGTDVFKALARGARAVFIGRPIIWGLACEGFEGAKQILQILKDEVETTMKLMGCSNIEAIEPSMVVHEDYFRNAKL